MAYRAAVTESSWVAVLLPTALEVPGSSPGCVRTGIQRKTGAGSLQRGDPEQEAAETEV